MSWFPWDALNFVVRKEKPDLIVVLSGLIARMGLAAKSLNIPTLLHVHDVAFYEHGGDFEGLRHLPCIANSRFTAEKYRTSYGIDPTVIYPFVAQERYKTDTTRKNITFINPHPEKGRDIAIKIARLCPEIPFTFVEGWRLSDQHRRELTDQLATLPKVTFLPSQLDMRKIYGIYARLSAAAVAHAQRLEMSLAYQIDAHEKSYAGGLRRRPRGSHHMTAELAFSIRRPVPALRNSRLRTRSAGVAVRKICGTRRSIKERHCPYEKVFLRRRRVEESRKTPIQSIQISRLQKGFE